MTTPAEWGPEFLVNTETRISQLESNIVLLADGRFAVVWEDSSEFSLDNPFFRTIRFQLFDADGSKIGNEQVLRESVTSPYSPAEVLSDATVTLLPNGNILLKFVSYFPNISIENKYQIINPEGELIGQELEQEPNGYWIVQTNTSDGHVASVRVAASDDDPSQPEIRLQYYDSDLTPTEPEITLFEVNAPAGGPFHLDVAELSNGNLLITWKQANANFSFAEAHGQVVEPDGTVVSGPFTLTNSEPYESANFFYDIAPLENGNFAVAWAATRGDDPIVSESGIKAKIFDSAGNPITELIWVYEHTPGFDEFMTMTAIPDGGFVVAWLSEPSDADDGVGTIRAQVVNSDGSLRGAPVVLSTTANDAIGNRHFTKFDIESLGDGRVIVSWTDVGQHLGDTSYHATHAQIIDARTGAVSLVGGPDSDRVAGTNFNDTLAGGDGDDSLFGGQGDDTLDGGDDDDVLSGGLGADELNGGQGSDTASYSGAQSGVRASLLQPATNTSEAAGDSYSSIENLTGSPFDDTLIGDAASNEISGEAGNDELQGGLGDDTLDGGEGVDTANYRSGATGGVNVDLSIAGAQNTGSAGSDTLISIENLSGTDFQDTLTGDGGDNLIEGFDGADTLDGGAGNDTVSYDGSSGGVTVNLLTGTVTGGHGTGDAISNFQNVLGSGLGDNLTGDGNDNVLTGGAGGDTLDGGAGTDTASYHTASAGVIASLAFPAVNAGDAFGDTYGSIENLEGSLFADFLLGDAGANRITGLSGDDIIEGGSGADYLDGGEGFDALSYLGSSSAVTVDLSTLTASGGDADGDVYANFEDIIGSLFDDTLKGDSGSNVLEGSAGADTLDGWSGFDLVSYVGSPTAVTVNMETGVTSGGDAVGDVFLNLEGVIGSAFDDVLTAADDITVEHLVFGGQGDDHLFAGRFGEDWLFGEEGDDELTGGQRHNHLYGGIGNDTLDGAGGNDTLTGGAGDDTVSGGNGHDSIIAGPGGTDVYDGGTGADTISYEDTFQGVTIDFFAGTASGTEVGNDVITNFERATGGSGDDDLTGDNGVNHLRGGAGNDTLHGFDGNDLIWGDDDADIMFGQRGSDKMFGGAGDDTIYAGLDDDSVEGGAGNDLIIGEDGNDVLIGNGEDDILAGDDGADTLDGGSGQDKLYGGAQDDILSGGDHADLLVGGQGSDVLDGGFGDDMLAGNDGADSADGGAGDDRIWGHDGADVLSGGGDDDDLFGGAGADTLNGNDGDDELIGGADGDLLDGGAGRDNMFGGLGNDTLDGGADNDVLYGQGGDDLFVFMNGSGFDWVIDFTAGAGTEDRLDITDFGFSTFAQVQAAAFDVGTDLRIQLDADDFVTLKNVAEADLHEDDFFGIT